MKIDSKRPLPRSIERAGLGKDDSINFVFQKQKSTHVFRSVA